jgi:ParB-like chromosome segregation protein Spo0J
MQIELRDITAVQPYDRNPRINDGAVDAVAASLREFGFRQPIVVDQFGTIIAGHVRHKAAIKMGMKKVPVYVATDLTPEQVRAYRLADNKTHELSDWDFSLLEKELEGLDFDMTQFGFDSLDFDPVSADEVPRLDEIETKPIICPHCGREFQVTTTLLRK